MICNDCSWVTIRICRPIGMCDRALGKLALPRVFLSSLSPLSSLDKNANLGNSIWCHGRRNFAYFLPCQLLKCRHWQPNSRKLTSSIAFFQRKKHPACFHGCFFFFVFAFDSGCLMASTSSIISSVLRESIVILTLMALNWWLRTARNRWNVIYSEH